MRVVIAALMMMVSSTALAQDIGIKEIRYAAEDVLTDRFPTGAEVAGPQLITGDRIEVILVEGDRVRIAKGERFGWVDAAKLTTIKPMAPLQMPPPGMPGMQPPGLPPLNLPK